MLDKEELDLMAKGLKIALNNAKGVRFVIIEGMYAEGLVAQKLVELGRTVEFHGQPFDLTVDKKHKVEVKCGKLWGFGASASFGDGKQIEKKKFDYCVFVIIDKETLDPLKFFVFSRSELEECKIHRPKMTMKETPSILFYYKNFQEFEKESKETGEPIFEVERYLHFHPEQFQDRWDKIGDH